MAGSGVNVGGTAMLRTRRRDVSIKPNRRLDRKSSRGMIYENEELRLRTININAEVEQGQNDIKKLRRENEQLRREIWSLRDEYDKLEELVKNQSSHGSSDELEGRSGEEENVDDVYTEYSGDEDVVDEEEEDGEGEEDEEEEEEEEEEEGEDEEEGEAATDGGKSQEEDLENVENQKISSEKMNSSLHRLHVEFDDLSVVDEEEEVKKEREKKDSVFSEDFNRVSKGSDPPVSSEQKSSDERNYPYFTSAAEKKYFNDSPFVFPNPSDPNYPKMLPIDHSNIYNAQLTPLPSLDTPGIGTVDPIFGRDDFPTEIPTPFNFRDNFNPAMTNLPQRRNIRFKQPVNFFNDPNSYGNHSSNLDTPNSGDTTVAINGWDFGRVLTRESVERGDNYSERGVSSGQDKPKHFFAPMPYKLRVQKSLDDNYTRNLDTATSSSSEKTTSTVVSRNDRSAGKGTADVYVNGGFPVADDDHSDEYRGGFLTSENLLVEEVANISRQSSNNPLVKSLSCHDLSSDPQTLPFSEKLKLFNAGNPGITKSDNTLDNISINSPSRPFRSQLNVTLKLPKTRVPSSPDTPEIPKLPLINYRLFNNPFLQNYHETQDKVNHFNIECPMTRPLSIQVNEDPRTPGVNKNKIFNFNTGLEDPCLLLMAANQFRDLEEKSNTRRANIGFEMTSFEGPSPQTLLPQVNPVIQNQRLYRGVNTNGQIILGLTPSKVPAQTQTSIDGDSHVEDSGKKSSKDHQGPSVPGSPLTLRRKRTLRKERSGSIKDKRPLSPAAQRRKDRLRKQNSLTSSEAPESPAKTPQRSRKFSVTTSTSAGDIQEKNESRSSSSGQDSPKKGEQRRRVSLYFNAKKRPSLVSTSKIDRRSSLDNVKDRRYSVRTDPQDATTTNSERERTNSVSSRDTVTKGRKMSTGSGKVPWCACWGNGCV